MKANKTKRKDGSNRSTKQIQFKQVPNGIETVTIGRALNKEGRKLEEAGLPVPDTCVIRKEFSFDRPLFKTVKLFNGQMVKNSNPQ